MGYVPQHATLMPSSRFLSNAWLDDGLTLRVGVPHFNGALPAHCAEQDMPIMVSAGAYWRAKRGEFAEPGMYGWTTDATNVALDSAGFVAMRLWAEKGPQAGMEKTYPWTLAQYLQLVTDVQPRWWSAPDACCEPAVAGDDAAVRARMAMTRRLLEQTLVGTAALHAQYPGLPLRPPVPVLQGWTLDHYARSLEETLMSWEVFTRGTRFERQPTLVGIGSVCRRDLRHPEHGLWSVLDWVAKRLPSGIKLHLYGVKGQAMAELRHFPMVASVDSMAWDFGARISARKAGVSNTLERRVAHLDRWRDAQLARTAKPQLALAI